jgi:transposase
MRAQTKQRIKIHTLRQQASGASINDTFKPVMTAFSKAITVLDEQISIYDVATQKLLRSIPGIGQVTAGILVAHIGDVTRFPSPEQLVAYIGLDPRVHQSGTSINGKGYITKRGSTYVRSALFNASFIARQKNPELKAYFNKKIQEGKHYFAAQCAVERKLVHLIYAIWKRGTPYQAR